MLARRPGSRPGGSRARPGAPAATVTATPTEEPGMSTTEVHIPTAAGDVDAK